MGPEAEPFDALTPPDRDDAQLASELAGAGRATALTSTIDAALGFLASLAFATVGGADGASVTLRRGGAFVTVASTDETILRMDGHQYDTGQGPCLDAAIHGRWIQTDSLAAEHRWPDFGPRALEEGISSILSTPILGVNGPRGALNLYSRRARSFSQHQRARAATYAAQASGVLVVGSTEVSGDQLEHRIARSLTGRRTIALAEGMIMAQRHVSAEVAAAILHRAARAGEITVLQCATDMTAVENEELIG